MKIIESKGIICKKGRNPKRLLVLLLSAILLSSIVLTASAEEWNGRRAINITNNGGSNLTNYQVLVTLNNFDYSKANPDGSDLRFTDFSDTVRVRKYAYPEPTLVANEQLTVDFSSADVNEQSLEGDNPMITATPAENLRGYLEVTVNNQQPGNYITPVIGTCSWGRAITGEPQGWYECIEYWVPTGSSTQRFDFELTAPEEPGVYYIGVFAGWMYNEAEVAANDHPPLFGDGNDIWDMPTAGWDEIIETGKTYKGPYNWPGRVIKVIVAPIVPNGSPAEFLTVDFSKSNVNGILLDGKNPVIVIYPGDPLIGYLEVIVNNEQPGNYITPVIGTCSWGRMLTGGPKGWFETLNGWAPTGTSTEKFNFRLLAPQEPGTYHIGVFAGWMYNEAEVAANDHPAGFGDHDDVWDMPLAGWDELIQYGTASTGPYHLPGRAIKVIVPSLQDPFIWSIRCNPANIQLGDTVTVNVMVRNPLPYGGWCTLDLFLDKNQRQPYDLQDAARFWIDAQNNRNVNFVLKPQEVGRYSCRAVLNWTDHSGMPKQNVRNWAHCVNVGDVPYIWAIWWNKREVLLGETVTAYVIVRNPDIRTRDATWTLDIDQDLPNLNPECRRSRRVRIPPGGLNFSNFTITPSQIGPYKQEANLSIGGTLVDWLPPQYAFKVVEVEEEPESIQRITKVTFEVSPDVTTRVTEPNGGERWITSGTHSIYWEKTDLGDKVEVKVTVENSDDTARDCLLTVLFDRDRVLPYDSLQSDHHLIIGNGQHTFTFTFTPIEAWQEGEDRESDYYLRVGLSDFIKGETIEQRPWSGPIKLRKDGAVVTQNSVYILYSGTKKDFCMFKVPNDDVYFPKDSNQGESHVWILTSDYPDTDQAKVRVELFDEDNYMVASDESDAVFSILLSGPTLR